MFKHNSVLKEEAVNGLAIKPDGTYIDCTVGGGGHAAQIASRLSSDGLLIAFDQDPDALKAAEKQLSNYKDRILFVHANFRELETKLSEMKTGPVNGVLFDLGVSSPQLDKDDRGFSYQHDVFLDMRMNQKQDLTASEIVNNWSYEQLTSIFFQYGEEKFSKQIARKIEDHRNRAPIETTYQMVNIIKDAIPAAARRKGGHPAKRIFQALRIAVNDELTAFLDGLHQAARVIAINGRISVITFHSLEDRLCKQAFKKWSTTKEVPRNLPVIPKDHEAPFQLINKKPINPSDEELERNRRARSAKLRIAEKTGYWNEEFVYTKGWKKHE